MAKRFVIEGTWSGYISSQCKVVHRTVISEKKVREIKEQKLTGILYSDNTWLTLQVREALPREKVQKMDSYTSLIDKCLREKKYKVEDLT